MGRNRDVLFFFTPSVGEEQRRQLGFWLELQAARSAYMTDFESKLGVGNKQEALLMGSVRKSAYAFKSPMGPIIKKRDPSEWERIFRVEKHDKLLMNGFSCPA